VGKSFFLFYVIKKLLQDYKFSEKEIFYINKEWLEYEFITGRKRLYEYFEQWKTINQIGNHFFVGIDEIQEIQ
jgi:hypothetical protein